MDLPIDFYRGFAFRFASGCAFFEH